MDFCAQKFLEVLVWELWMIFLPFVLSLLGTDSS